MTKTYCKVPKTHWVLNKQYFSSSFPEVTGDPYIENCVGLQKGKELEGKYPPWLGWAANENYKCLELRSQGVVRPETTGLAGCLQSWSCMLPGKIQGGIWSGTLLVEFTAHWGRSFLTTSYNKCAQELGTKDMRVRGQGTR